MTILTITILAIIIFNSLKKKQGLLKLTPRGEQIKNKWGYLTAIASLKWGIPENVIIGIIGVESDGNEYAIGKAKEIGLMQLLPSTFSDYEKENNLIAVNRLNPVSNIDAGSWYLSKIQNNFSLEKWNEKVQAYKVGIAGYRNGRRNSDYIDRFKLFVV